MPRIIFRTFLAAAFAASLFAMPDAQADADIGKPAPDFTAKDTNGKEISLSQFKGKYVVLEWTNHGCPFVRKHYGSGNMQALQKKYTAKGVEWISIISSAEGKQGYVNDQEANELTQERHASPSAVIRDPKGEIGRLYGAKTTPHMFVIDKDGTLVYKGAIDSIPSPDKEDIAKARNYVDLAFADLEAGRKVATPVTQSYGCAVKY
jgi:peroxiredoxin